MIPGNFDPSSIILLFLGKDHPWIPLIVLTLLIVQKWDDIKHIYYNISMFNKTQYVVSGTFYTNIDDNHTYGGLGIPVWSLIRFINKLVKADKTLLSNAINIKFPYNDVFEDDDIITIPNSKTIIKLTNNINCIVEISYNSRDTSRADHQTCTIDSTTIKFSLTTKKTFDIITDFMNKIIKEHTSIVASKNKENNYIVKPTFDRKCDENGVELEYPETITFNSSKNFGNLFFDSKDELINRLNSFKNREKYKSLGLPETLGLLFYGEPGTGKTSCIKAVAHYLDMSIILVPMTQIKTKKRLEELFFSSRIRIPQNKRLYVFEEIDCNGWENIIKDRRFITEEKQESTVQVIEQIAASLKQDDKKDDRKEDKLTLGNILEIIDGIIECPGRVIIMTTNHKDKLDPALLRPGRIDMEIEFKKLRRCHIAEIYKKWYGKTISNNKLENVCDYKYTQAEISQLLFKYENDPEKFIKEIQSI
jgi:ATP-dependent 26S proteasome regulatory subunit